MGRNEFVLLANDSDKPPLVFGYEVSSSHGHQSLSFPLGAGMVVLSILLISAIFSFCYHWFRLKKLASYHPPPPITAPDSTAILPPIAIPTKHLELLACPPVVFVAGEHIPRYIAVPCPLLVSGKQETDYCDDDQNDYVDYQQKGWSESQQF